MKEKVKPYSRGILFDMDRVLLLSPDQSPAQSWQEVARQFAPLLDIFPESPVQALQESRHAYKREIKYDAEKQRRDRLRPFETRLETVENVLKALNRENTSVAADMVRAYEALREAHLQLAFSALDLLQALRKQAFPLALISNGNVTYQRRKIVQHGLAPFFDAILIEEEFGIEKPNRRIFLAALDQLCVSAHEAWMIGDVPVRDIAGAQQVGIFAVWCDLTGQRFPDTIHPDWIIHDFSEVRTMLSL